MNYARHRFAAAGKWREVKGYFERPNPTWPDAVLVRSAWIAAGPLGNVLKDRLVDLRDEIVAEYPTSTEPWSGRWKGQKDVYRSFIAGLLSVRLDDWESVTHHAAVLRDFAESDGRGSFSDGFATTLEAYLAWNNGDTEQAKLLLANVQIPYGSPASWWDGRMFDRHLRAVILMDERRFREALEVWESLAQRHWVYMMPSYLYRAQCHEALGETERAIAYYEEFVDLWKDADPELQPMVEEARAGLDRLLDAEAREPS